MLGEAQWAWLEAQLRQPAELRLLVSSIQVVSAEHGWEKWENLPRERARLFALLAKTKAEGVVVLSGDRHKGELSVMDAGLGYPLYDFTSSGLNTGHKQWFHFEENRHRVATMRWGDNFGILDVDWGDADPTVEMTLKYADGQTAFTHRVRLSTLKIGSLPALPPFRVDSGAKRTGPLAHFVFFDLKPDVSSKAFMAELEKLKAIDSVSSLSFGPFEDLADPRALSNFEVVMELRFESRAGYDAYQRDPIHLSLKKALGAMLAGPPATYDFVHE